MEVIMNLQKLGGYASIAVICAGIGSVVMSRIMFPGTTTDLNDPVSMIAAYKASPIAFGIYYVLGIFGSILTLLIVLALQEPMQAKAPNLMRLAVIAASIFAALNLTAMIGGFFRNVLLAGTNDMSAFRTFLVLHELLGTSAISALGWGFLLIGWAALRMRALPRMLSYAVIAFGCISIVLFAFIVWQVQVGYTVFQFLSLVVFVWLGPVLLRDPKPIPAQT
jgi:hypothetical protein